MRAYQGPFADHILINFDCDESNQFCIEGVSASSFLYDITCFSKFQPIRNGQKFAYKSTCLHLKYLIV